jgi:hypothetical protein
MTESEWLYDNPPPVHRFITSERKAKYNFLQPDKCGSQTAANIIRNYAKERKEKRHDFMSDL